MRYFSSFLPVISGLFISVVPFCSLPQQTQKDEPCQSIYNLSESTQIIRDLITMGSLNQILLDSSQEQIEMLLNNFSPAQMAFESEILNCTLPVIIHFYSTESNEKTTIKTSFEQLAKQYKDTVKFVTIDTEALFSLAELAQIEQLPTLIFINKREEIMRLEGDVTKHEIEQALRDTNIID